MALIRQSVVVGAISGAIGGVIAKQTRQGQILTHRPPRINRPTPAALAARARFANATRAWADLTDDERREWATFAQQRPLPNRLGIRRTLTAFQMYMRGGQFQFENAANGTTLYAGTRLLWTWDWTTLTLTIPATWDIDTTQSIGGAAYGALSATTWTDAQKTLAIAVNNEAKAIIDVTSSQILTAAIDTTYLAATTDVQKFAVATSDNSYINAWRAATQRLETYMHIDTAGLITLAGSLTNSH